jgi:hypothetical protein
MDLTEGEKEPKKKAKSQKRKPTASGPVNDGSKEVF